MKKILACAVLMAWGLQGLCQEAKEEPKYYIDESSTVHVTQTASSAKSVRDTIAYVAFASKRAKEPYVVWFNPCSRTIFLAANEKDMPFDPNAACKLYLQQMQSLKGTPYERGDYWDLTTLYCSSFDMIWKDSTFVSADIRKGLERELFELMPFPIEDIAYNPDSKEIYAPCLIPIIDEINANNFLFQGIEQWLKDRFIEKQSEGEFVDEAQFQQSLAQKKRKAVSLAKKMRKDYVKKTQGAYIPKIYIGIIHERIYKDNLEVTSNSQVPTGMVMSYDTSVKVKASDMLQIVPCIVDKRGKQRSKVEWFNPFIKTFFLVTDQENCPKNWMECDPIIQEYLAKMKSLKGTAYEGGGYKELSKLYQTPEDSLIRKAFETELLKPKKMPVTIIENYFPAFNGEKGIEKYIIVTSYTPGFEWQMRAGLLPHVLDVYIKGESKGYFPNHKAFIEKLEQGDYNAISLANYLKEKALKKKKNREAYEDLNSL